MPTFLRMCVLVLVAQATASDMDDFQKSIDQLKMPMMMMNASAMLAQVEKMASSGKVPDPTTITTIKGLIVDVVAALVATHQAAVDQEKANVEAIEQDDKDMNTKAAELKGLEDGIKAARLLHADCRAAEEAHYIAKHTSGQPCQKLTTFMKAVSAPDTPPGNVADATGKYDSAGRTALVEYIKAQSAKDMCKGATLETISEECTQDEKELTTEQQGCHAKQAQFETDFCSWRTHTVSMCTEHATARKKAQDAYDNHKATTTALMVKWNVEGKSLDKITCYCEVWLSAQGTSPGVCTSNPKAPGCIADCTPTPTETPLAKAYDVTFTYGKGADVPQLDAEGKIVTTSCVTEDSNALVNKYPGTDAFAAAEYAAFQGATKEGVVVPKLVSDPLSCEAPASPTCAKDLATACVAALLGELKTCAAVSNCYKSHTCCESAEEKASREALCGVTEDDKCTSGDLLQKHQKGKGFAQLFELSAEGVATPDHHLIRREGKAAVKRHETGIRKGKGPAQLLELKAGQTLEHHLIRRVPKKVKHEMVQLDSQGGIGKFEAAKTYSSSDLEAMEVHDLLGLVKSLGVNMDGVKHAMKVQLENAE